MNPRQMFLARSPAGSVNHILDQGTLEAFDNAGIGNHPVVDRMLLLLGTAGASLSDTRRAKAAAYKLLREAQGKQREIIQGFPYRTDGGENSEHGGQRVIGADGSTDFGEIVGSEEFTAHVIQCLNMREHVLVELTKLAEAVATQAPSLKPAMDQILASFQGRKVDKFIHGDWSHIFEDNGPDVPVRFVYDTELKAIVAMETESPAGHGWISANKADVRDLEHSFLTANEEALSHPDSCGLTASTQMPAWALQYAKPKGEGSYTH